MKTTKKLITLLLALLGITQMVAQEYEYVPLVREGVKWVYYYVNSDEIYPPDPNLSIGTVYFTLELKGDTVIDGKTYKAMHKYYGDNINNENDTVPIYLREENKIVYGIVPSGKIYADCPISCFGNETINSKILNGQEFILYDFNDPVAFCQTYSDIYQYYEAIYEEEGDRFFNPFKFSDMVTINGHQAKRYVFNIIWNCCFIEGIGFDGIGDGYLLAFGYDRLMSAPVFSLSHVIENGKVIYQAASRVNKPYLPMAREGVKWVNEHVSILDGDTTCYYYTYEFKHIEDNSLDYNCYYSTEDELNPCNDSIVSLGRNSDHVFSSIQNKMLIPIMERGENMIDFHCTNTMHNIYELYYFEKSDISPFCLLNYYIDFQKSDLLNRENFVEIEPLMIEGVSCSRYAYVNEQGDTMCYVVEGIGFDSKCMGDLLTPFTRIPDPNADYQEYCGLSHVIKDGQIIYKGMRYRNLYGDVDGDGEVTIADANSVIDIVVMGGNSSHTRTPAADVNSDGEVSIADVNAIIEIILGKN